MAPTVRVDEKQAVELLRGTLDRLARGRGEAVAIRGGTPATRARVAAGVARESARRGVAVHRIRVPPFGGAPFLPVRTLLRNVLGVDGRRESSASYRAAVRACTALGVAPADGMLVGTIVAGWHGRRMPLPIGADMSGPFRSVSGGKLVAAEAAAVGACLRACAREAPRLIVVEDLAAADQHTLSTMRELAAKCADVPVLLLATSTGLAPRGSLRVLTLRGGPSGTAELSEIGRRLTRCSPEARELAGLAAAMGGSIERRLATRLMPRPESTTAAAAELRRECLASRATGGKIELAHDDVRRVVVGGMEVEPRRTLHRRLAEELERSRDEGRIRPELLGHLWEQAGEPAKAAPHYCAAWRYAWEASAPSEAERLFAIHRRVSPEPSWERIHVSNFHGHERRLRGDSRGALAHHRSALADARRLGLSEEEASTLREMGETFELMGRGDAARRSYRRALRLRGKETGRMHRWWLLHLLGILELREGRLAAARRAVEESIALRPTGHLEDHARDLCRLASIDMARGRHSQAVAHMERALETAKLAKEPALQAAMESAMAEILHVSRRIPDAVAHAESALLLARTHEKRRLIAAATRILGALHVDQGRLDDALECALRAAAMHREQRDTMQEAAALVTAGQVERYLGRRSRARRRIERAAALLDRVKGAAMAGVLRTAAHVERGFLALATGLDERTWIRRARATARRAGPLGRRLAWSTVRRLERAAVARRAGEPLVQGERARDVAPSIALALRRRRASG